MRPGDGGANFGWRVFEGTQLFSGPAITGTVPPVAEYGHGTGPRQGNSVTGGYVYRGPVEALRGQYFFGDFDHRQYLVDSDARGSASARRSPPPSSSLRTTDFTPNLGRDQQYLRASASTSRAISISSTSTARFSGSSRPEPPPLVF